MVECPHLVMDEYETHRYTLAHCTLGKTSDGACRYFAAREHAGFPDFCADYQRHRADAAEEERDQLREAVGLLQHMDEVLDMFMPYLELHSHLWTPKALLSTVQLAVAKVFLKLEEIGLVRDATRTKEWAEQVINGESSRGDAWKTDAEGLVTGGSHALPGWCEYGVKHGADTCPTCVNQGCPWKIALTAHAELKAKEAGEEHTASTKERNS